MVLSQIDGSHLVLIYEAILHILLLAIHSEFYKLVGEGEGRGEKKSKIRCKKR